MKCHLCNGSDFLLKCNYCKEFFCTDHRLPISHSCSAIDRFTEKRKMNLFHDNFTTNSFLNNFSKTINIRFSRTEIKHLLVATFLVLLVGMSFNNYRYISFEFLVIFIIAFLFHELAHKFLANFYGSWAEFRAEVYGLIVTAISAIPFIPFKFIAPGAVIVGISDKEKLGKVALIGPITNLVMGFLFLLLSYLYPFLLYFNIGASFNAWISMFNLLPFGVLDGQKIFNWNKLVWFFTMAITMTLFIISYNK
jgi:Zn-dependent protease